MWTERVVFAAVVGGECGGHPRNGIMFVWSCHENVGRAEPSAAVFHDACLELMASVHYLMANEKLLDGDSLCAGIHSWTPQKRRFTRAQIERVVLALKKNGFVPADCNAP